MIKAKTAKCRCCKQVSSKGKIYSFDPKGKNVSKRPFLERETIDINSHFLCEECEEIIKTEYQVEYLGVKNEN